MERRNFSRLKLNIPVTVFTNEGMELTGHINNISEEGINITIAKDEAYLVADMNSCITIQFVDMLRDGQRDICAILTTSAHILRADIKESEVQFGCLVKDPVYENYVARKKVENFLEHSKKLYPMEYT